MNNDTNNGNAEPATDASPSEPSEMATEAPVEASEETAAEFAREADAAEMGLLAEFWDFLVHNKAWWLTPIILVLLLVFLLVLLAGTPIAPFIYGA